ncbi:hypothetical protein [Helicobacter salomonis]|uniref:hypothetical protein n=1 Tax=Helicobacter salomonis TaxID=56878 RepID=UPI000CF0D6F9|nr:hypothetical protein [Helicobacter salomonis]
MKLAKFALTCDGEKITSLEQLKEHFNLLDVLEHYKTNTLWRWLRSRGYQNELAGIEAITATQDTEILKALCEVFGIEADLQMIQETPENHRHMQENEALKAELKACKEQLRTLQAMPPAPQHTPDSRDYLKSYNALKDKLFDAQDLESGKAVLKELLEDYGELLEMDRMDVLINFFQNGYQKGWRKHSWLVALFLYIAYHLLKEYEFYCTGVERDDCGLNTLWLLDDPRCLPGIDFSYIRGTYVVKPNVITCVDFMPLDNPSGNTWKLMQGIIDIRSAKKGYARKGVVFNKAWSTCLVFLDAGETTSGSIYELPAL